MSHAPEGRSGFTPERIQHGLRVLAERTGEWWPEDKRLTANPFAWLDEVISRERAYFDRTFDSCGGIHPREAFARVEVYDSALRDASQENLAGLRQAVDRALTKNGEFHARVERQLDTRRATASAVARRTRKYREGMRWLDMSRKRHVFCAALLERFRQRLDRLIPDAAEVSAAPRPTPLPTPRDSGVHRSIRAASTRPATEVTHGRSSRKHA